MRAGNHRAVIYAQIEFQPLGKCLPMLWWTNYSYERIFLGIGMLDNISIDACAAEFVIYRICTFSDCYCILLKCDRHPHYSSPTIIGFSESRPELGAPPILIIFSRNRPNPSIRASGLGGHPGM